MNHTLHHLLIVSAVCVFCGCKTDVPKPKTSIPSSNTANQKSNQTATQTAAQEPEVKVPPPAFVSELVPYVALGSMTFTDPIGKLSGEIYGNDRDILAIARANCGGGTVLQAIYQTEKGVRVSGPLPTQFLNLATKKPVSYADGDFTVTIDFDEDSPARLKGSMSIGYKTSGVERNYVSMTVDGKPIKNLLPPKLDGKGTVPLYNDCVATGFFHAQIEGLPDIYGYVNAEDVGGLGVPKIRVMLSSQDGVEMLLIPLSKGGEFTDAQIDMETSRVKGKNPAVLEASMFRVAELVPPEEAITFNLEHTLTAGIYEGVATASLDKSSASVVLENFTFAETLGSAFSEYKVKRVQIETGFIRDGSMVYKLPEPPQWWKHE